MSDATPPPPPQDPNQGSTPPPPPPPAAPTPPPAAPTPPPPPGGVAPAAPAAGGPVMQNGMGTAALILGILQFFCLGTIGSILAIIFGWIGMKKVKEGFANNGGQAKAGFILGIVGVVLSIITAIIVIIAVIAGGKAVGEMVDVSKNSQTGLADGTYGLVPTSNVNINDERCSFTGAPISAETQEVVGMGDVTVVGTNSAECHFEKGGPSLVMFQVSGGVAKIVSVE